MNNSNIVYIVHCIDTEGPMYESLEESFKRLEIIFNIQLEPNEENLKKLQKGEIPLDGHEQAIATMLDPHRLKLNETWDQINQMLKEILSQRFRERIKDSFGGGWIYNWFCLDHVGFNGLNPRRRDVGYHNIFDHYRRINKQYPQDLIQWHYHPLSLTGNYNDNGVTYLNSNTIWEILSRKVIERSWFPSAFRPGFHTERPDSHWFLEQWIPFDYGNQSMKNDIDDQPDLAKGRFGDWRMAPKEWQPYHPSHENYQLKGSCRRLIARCLNMEARIRQISVQDIDDAFSEAANKGTSLLSFTNHDFRDMKPEIEKMQDMIKNVSERYPNVKFKFVDAITAMREVASIEKSSPCLKYTFVNSGKDLAKLNVTSEGKIFGSQPFLAIKLLGNKYIWENFDYQGENSWSFTFDNTLLPFKFVEKISIASNSPYGEMQVLHVYDRESNPS